MTPGPETALPSESTPTQEPVGDALTFREVYDPETDCNSDLCFGFSTLLRTDDAYYYPGISGAYLYYYDKASGESDVLCPKPECLHDSERYNTGCAGFISAFDGQTVSYYNGKIYFDHQTASARIMYRMNPDGTGWERLFNIDCEAQYQAQRLAVHRGKVYGANFSTVVQEAVPYETWNITCWDLETGEFKLIYEEYTGGISYMEFFGDFVYFSHVTCNYEKNEDGTFVTDKDGMKTIVDKTLEIFRYDTRTEELEKILDLISDEIEGTRYAVRVVSEDRIYAAAVAGAKHVYMISGCEQKEVLSLGFKYNVRLYEDCIFAYSSSSPEREHVPGNLIMHFLIMDYDGNKLFEGDVTPFPKYGVEGLSEDGGIGVTTGAFYADNAFFFIYTYELSEDFEPESWSRTCLIKYDLIDGELQETLIATEKWE